MTSLLRYWLSTGTPAATVPETNTSNSSGITVQVSPPSTSAGANDDEDEDGSETETERDPNDDDRPPAFPSLSSAQRMKTSAPSLSVSRVLTDTELMPPPPLSNRANRSLGAGSQSGSSTLLAVPPTTTKPPASSKKRGKVALAPGHSPLDWASYVVTQTLVCMYIDGHTRLSTDFFC